MEFIALVLALVAVIWARKANNRSLELNARLTQLNPRSPVEPARRCQQQRPSHRR
jgi:hypothetical protein